PDDPKLVALTEAPNPPALAPSAPPSKARLPTPRATPDPRTEPVARHASPPPSIDTPPPVSIEPVAPTPEPWQTPTVRSPIARVESLEAETELLRRATLALQAKDLARANELLAEHERRFPNGILVEEREAQRV